MTVFNLNAPRGRAAPPSETLLWTFGVAYRSTFGDALNEEDVEIVGGNLAVTNRTNAWSGGAITTLCGLAASSITPNFFNNAQVGNEVPELTQYTWFDGTGNNVDIEIHVPAAQAGLAWRIYAGWGNDAAATSTRLFWKDGVASSPNGFTLIGDYPSLPSDYYAAINDTRYGDGSNDNSGALAWLADYDNQYLSVSLSDQGADTGFTLRTQHNGLRQRFCHWRVRGFG